MHADADLIIAKNRHGRTGRIGLVFDGPMTKFRNKAHQQHMEGM